MTHGPWFIKCISVNEQRAKGPSCLAPVASPFSAGGLFLTPAREEEGGKLD